MKSAKEKNGGSGRIFKSAAVISLVLALLCLVSPALRKGDALRKSGEAMLSEMRAAATVISYYSEQQIDSLIARPSVNADYKALAALLGRINSQQNYQKGYLLYRPDNKTLHCLVDGSYRDNAQAGTDYFALGAEYPVTAEYKPVKAVVDKIYGGKTTGGYTLELVTRADLKKVAVACLPIYGAGHSISAVLCIESDLKDTAFHMVGAINLYYAGLIFAGVFFICLLILALMKKHELRKQQKLEKEELLRQGEQPDAEPSAASAATADTALDAQQQPPPDKQDDSLEQAPGSNIDTWQ